jgi:hypothetical protein
MFSNKPVTTPNLNEELESLGISDKDMVRLSTGRLDETTSGAMAASIAVIGKSGPTGLGHGEAEVEEGDDPIDGKFVTRELFKRIANLPFDAMSESDFDEVLEALAEKDVPEGDDELRGLAEAVVSTLIDARSELAEKAPVRTKSMFGGTKKLCPDGFVSDGSGGCKRKTAQQKVATKMRSKGASGQRAKRTGKKYKKKHKNKLQRMARKRQREDVGLAAELSALMHESKVGSNPWGDTYSRVERVFGLIEFITGDEGVSDVLEQALGTLGESLNESVDESDALAAMKPALKVISKCLESIDSENP